MYISDELTHFVGAGLRPNKDKQFELLVTIVSSGILSSSPNPSNWANIAYGWPLRWRNGEFFGFFRACFCDIPLNAEDLAIHVRKYGEFGIAFKKSFLVRQGASPVFYIAENAIVSDRDGLVLGDHLSKNLDLMMTLLRDLRMNPGTPGEDSANENSLSQVAWRLELFVVQHIAGKVKGFDAKRPEDDSANYYMEREWRVSGGVRFSVGDISTIVIPTDYFEKFRRRVPAFQGKLLDPDAALLIKTSSPRSTAPASV
jgi:Putative abortive phage resistance protein AbiGi, antitoxin